MMDLPNFTSYQCCVGREVTCTVTVFSVLEPDLIYSKMFQHCSRSKRRAMLYSYLALQCFALSWQCKMFFVILGSGHQRFDVCCKRSDFNPGWSLARHRSESQTLISISESQKDLRCANLTHYLCVQAALTCLLLVEKPGKSCQKCVLCSEIGFCTSYSLLIHVSPFLLIFKVYFNESFSVQVLDEGDRN